MSMLHSLLDHFVAPPGDSRPAAHEDFAVPHGEEPDRACAEPAPRTPSGVAVLTAAVHAQSVGAALGLALARRRGVPAVLVCVWTAERPARPAWRAPALPAARRLAAALAARGHDARPAGRLALVRLPPETGDGAAQARRALAAAGAAPTVLALGGPRAQAFDALLAEQDLVVVAIANSSDAALASLAVGELAAWTVRACVCDVPQAHPARTLAAAGLTLLPSARRSLAGPVEALS